MKRILSIFTALCIAMSCCAITVLAADEDFEEVVTPQTSAEQSEEETPAEPVEAAPIEAADEPDKDETDEDEAAGPLQPVTPETDERETENAETVHRSVTVSAEKGEFVFSGAYINSTKYTTVTEGKTYTLEFICDAENLPWKTNYDADLATADYLSARWPRNADQDITIEMTAIKESDPDGGTRFTVRVPVICEKDSPTILLSLAYGGTAIVTEQKFTYKDLPAFKNNTEPTVQNSNDLIYRYLGAINSNGKEVKTITKGSKVTLQFLIIDPNYPYNANYASAANATFFATYTSEHMPPRLSEDITFTVENSARYALGGADPDRTPKNLAFVIEVPVTYDGAASPSARLDFSYGNDTTNYIAFTDNYHTFNISNYKEKDTSKEDEDDEEAAPLTPYIIVSSYSYGGNSVTAGNDFYLELTLRNTSADCDLENIVMNLRPQGVFSVASSSNTIYLEKLPAEGEINQRILINAGMTKLTEDKDSNTINISFQYQYYVDKTLKNGDSSESITIPVNYPDRFELGMIELGGTAFAGEEYDLYIPMVNKGRSSVYNLSAIVRCEGCNPVQSQFIGNLNAGTETGADFSLIFPEGGDFTGEIVVTYEDANMTERTVSQPFTVSVTGYEYMNFEENPFPEEDMMEGPDAAPASTGWLDRFSRNQKIGIAAGVVAVAGFAALMIRRKRKAKELMDDEEI